MPTIPDAGRAALPSPEDLKKYDAAHPGLGRQIIAMVQEEQRHLHHVERAEVALTRRGQLFGFIVAISFLVVSAVLVGLGHTVAGTVIGSVDLVALTTVFVVGKRSQDNSLGPSQADSTDRLIRELRRARSRGVKARKPKRKEQATSRAIEQDSNNLTFESSTGASIEESKSTASPTEDPDSTAPGVCEPSLSAEVDAPTTGENLLDTPLSAVEERRELTDEDIELYRRLYNNPDWNPNEKQAP